MKRQGILIIYIILFTLLYISIFRGASQEQAAVPTTDVSFAVINQVAKLPKTPEFVVTNNTDEAITINNCDNLEIRKDGQIRELPAEFCQDFEIEAKQEVVIFGDDTEHKKLFQEKLSDTNLEFSLIYSDGDIRINREVSIRSAGPVKAFFRAIFYQPIYNLLVVLVSAMPGKSLGLAIIAITIIIRLILLIPQQKIMVSQRKLQTLQPKIKAIQDKYKGDQAKIGVEMMALYKKEKVNPLGSCLPLLIQIPLLIVLYWVILGIGDVANTYHLYDFIKGFDIESIQTSFLGLHLLESRGMAGLILALVVAGSQFAQMKLAALRAPKKPKEKKPEKPKNPNEPQMPDMQKMGKVMMYILPVMVGFFTYQFPAGVGLYWLVGTLFMTGQQFVVNKIVSEPVTKKSKVVIEAKEVEKK